MTVPLDLYQLLFSFPLNRVGTNEDVAEFTLSMSGIDGAVYNASQLSSAAQGAINAWQDHVDQDAYCTNVVFGSVTATNFLADGTINNQQQEPATGGWTGTSTAAAMPWETSLATSLYTYTRGTFVPHGRRKRGRFYLPPGSSDRLDPSNSGYYNNSMLSDVLSQMKAFLNAAQQDMLGVPIGVLGVYSRVDSLVRPVTQVTLDAKIDSQRRRQNRELAGYIVTPFPP